MVILNKLVVVVVVLTRVSLQENTEMDVFAWRPKKNINEVVVRRGSTVSKSPRLQG